MISFPTHADNALPPRNVSDDFSNSMMRRGFLNRPQYAPSVAFQIDSNFTRTGSDVSNESIPVFANQQNIVQPFQLSYCNEQTANAISMGSASSFSDCDSTTISHLSHEENQEHNNYGTYQQKQKDKSERTLIMGQSIANSLIAFNEDGMQEVESSQFGNSRKRVIITTSPLSDKRIRCASDFDSVELSSPSTIIARPRNLTVNIIENDDSVSTNLRFVKGNEVERWQNACRNASHGYDSALPTLEEAALLFGFAKKN